MCFKKTNKLKHSNMKHPYQVNFDTQGNDCIWMFHLTIEN